LFYYNKHTGSDKNILKIMLTRRQKEVLDFVENYLTKKGYAPSFDEIRKRLKVASVSTVNFHVSKLERGGYLEKIKNKARAINIVKKPILEYPLLVKEGCAAVEEFIITEEIKKERKLPLNQVILGDAIQELRKLPDESCDIVVADPPYNIGKDFGNNIDKREIGEYVAWCKIWINESIRALKPNGTMFIYGFSEILAFLSIEIPIQKRWLIWHYTNKNVASLNFWQRSHEAIICAWKNKPIFNRDEVREPYTEGFLNGAAGKVRKGTLGRFSGKGMETVYNAHKGGALPRDVIKIPALAGGAGMVERWFLCKTCDGVYEPRQLKNHEGHEIMKHPTQKPYELSKKLIKSAMPKKNGVVLVPFVGTGSECAAAKELGQSYIGFEINPDYVRLAEKMISDKKPIAKLF